MMDNLVCLKHLEENGGNKMVGLDGGKGEPLIITAIEYGSNIVARWLLETTALVNNKFVNYYNPLHCAANFGSREIALLLLKQGADVNCTDYRLWTPLHYAASSGHVDVLELLISWKADINAECCSGYTALHNAGLENEEFCIQLLALVGGDLNQPSNNEKGVCLIHIAVAFEYENQVRWLLEKGVQVDIRSKAGMTGLMFASRLGHYDIAKLLIDKGANVNSKLYSGDNETPLHLACLGGNSALVQLLIENGADVNSRIRSYSLPVLHLAFAQNSQSIVELLIRNGADIHAKNSEGFTAVNTAVLSGYDKVKSLHTWRQINVNEYFKFS
jgi:ankyrin repeat protein